MESSLIIFSLIFSASFGALIGSFLNVCIYRIPIDKSIAWPGSACPKCKSPIRWFDNIPILSFIILKGRCRVCESHISIRYPLIEFLTALMFAAVYVKFGLFPDGLIYAGFISILIVITFIDLDHMIIPDVISLPGIPIGFICQFFLSDGSWKSSLAGAFIGGGFFFAIAWGYEKIKKLEGLGGGDIKLLGMIGAFLGVQAVFTTIIISSVLGTIVGITLMKIKNENMKMSIPFGPFLALGAIISLFWGSFLNVRF